MMKCHTFINLLKVKPPSAVRIETSQTKSIDWFLCEVRDLTLNAHNRVSNYTCNTHCLLTFQWGGERKENAFQTIKMVTKPF